MKAKKTKEQSTVLKSLNPQEAANNLKALELAIHVVSTPLFTLDNMPLNRDVKGVVSLAEIFRDFGLGFKVLRNAPTPEPATPTEEPTETEDKE